MTQMKEPVKVGTVKEPGDKKCIFCGKSHQKKAKRALPDHTYQRNDDSLTAAGRTFIKGDAKRSGYYPKDEGGRWVSPLEAPEWDEDTTFKTYLRNGKKIAHAEKYQEPPIKGWVAAPHHMVAVCCMNGENGLPGKPKSNPWAKKGGYDINGGGNCIFLPSSASQFFVAYYLARKRGTGKPLQGHLGAHRKVYFETVWSKLERLVRAMQEDGWCEDIDDDAKQDKLAKAVVKELHLLEAQLFVKVAARRPDPAFQLGADSYIEIPDDDVAMKLVRAKIAPFLQAPYETLPKWR
jgi:A nuclease family of the HNH/ENDO VII superfamily with conserved AHH